MIPKLMSHKVYIEELEKQIADLKDKLKRCRSEFVTTLKVWEDENKQLKDNLKKAELQQYAVEEYYKDKLHRRNVQIKDLKKELQNIYEKNAYLND